MHFVINVFVAGVCFISLILFKEIFNKIMKVSSVDVKAPVALFEAEL